MTHVFNDPADFAEESLDGFAALHAGLVRKVTGGVVARGRTRDGRVAIVVGGGSGHYPMFAGYVGTGLADGAVVGNIFTSPSGQFAYSVGKSADRGSGVVFCYGNYAGDVMNFGVAEERLRAEGIPAASVIVTDDVLSAARDELEKRRGIAGDFVVLRALAGAAAAGLSFDEVVATGARVNDRTRTVGVAFAGATFPGATEPLFEVPQGKMTVGLGVHGEPGLEDIDAVPADELARILFDHVVAEAPDDDTGRVAVVVNGLGATKAEELFVLWRGLLPLFEERGWRVIEPEVGEFITSMDMAGLSLTVTWLDDALEEYWCAPAYGPGYRKGTRDVASASVGQPEEEEDVHADEVVSPSSEASRAAARRALTLLGEARSAVRAAETDLARADSIAGDGDHGRGMVRGIDAATVAARVAVEAGAGVRTTLGRAGAAWAEHAGGSSGVLWGAALRAFGDALSDDQAPRSAELVGAATAFADSVQQLGRVSIGDKTMFDAIEPAAAAYREAIAVGESAGGAVQRAAVRAHEAAQATTELLPRVGRARPLAERSLGHPDPGALSFALILHSVAEATDRTEGSHD